jgi:antitoxin PrlF
MTTATVSFKGKITLPADVLRVLQVDAGDRIEFVEVGQ